MKQNEKYLSLERRILRASHLPDVLCGIVLLLYTVFILNLKVSTHYPLIIIVILGVLFAQFCVSPITNHILFANISKEVERWENESTTTEERTRLFLSLHKCPMRKAIEAFAYFAICAVMLAAAYHFIHKVNTRIN